MLCSILIPTYRSDEAACINLKSICAFATKHVHVRIADNSVNAEKHEFLKLIAQENSNISIYLHDKNIGGYENTMFLLEQSSNDEWIHIVADDNVVTWRELSGALSATENHPNAAAIAGHLIAVHQNGQLSAENHAYPQSTSSIRVQHWFNPSSWNLLYYGLVRRKTVQPWLNYLQGNPILSPFLDFLFAASVVASGPVYRHTEGAYLWYSDNWGSSESNYTSRKRWYHDIGLNEDFLWLFDLHFAVECASFMLGKYSPVKDANQRQQCAQIMWELCMQRFLNLLNQEQRNIVARWGNTTFIASLNRFSSMPNPIEPSTLKGFPDLLEHFNTNIANSYRRFQSDLFSF